MAGYVTRHVRPQEAGCICFFFEECDDEHSYQTDRNDLFDLR